MLNEKFLSRLSEAFPEFYERVNEEARSEAKRLLAETNHDSEKALVRARVHGAAKLWWPYVKGTVPVVGQEREAMEGFSRLVLTVNHVLGHEPAGMDAARAQVLKVLRDSLDYERLKDLLKNDKKEEAAAAAAGAGIAASVSALTMQVAAFQRVRKVARFMPAPARVAIAAVVVAAVASVPLVAGYSAGVKAEEAARGARQPATTKPENEPSPESSS